MTLGINGDGFNRRMASGSALAAESSGTTTASRTAGWRRSAASRSSG
jgi:hypothetical protein